MWRMIARSLSFAVAAVLVLVSLAVVGCDNTDPPMQTLTMDQIIASDHFQAELTKISENPEVLPFYGIRVDGTELWAFKQPDGTMRGFWLSQSEAQAEADLARANWPPTARTGTDDGLIPVVITK